MKAFVRGLWGIYDNSHRITNRRYKIDSDIQKILANKCNEPFIVYVMGRLNYEQLLKTGIESYGHKVKLISEEPAMFDVIKYVYRNKLEIIKYAMESDGFDEIVYLDWDCIPQKKIPVDFWETLRNKNVFLACLQTYKNLKCPWRVEYWDQRKVPNGGWVYFGDKTIPSECIKLWEEVGMPDNDEISYARWVDNKMGGWKGDQYFWDNFETPYCNLHRMSTHGQKILQKDICFKHFQG